MISSSDIIRCEICNEIFIPTERSPFREYVTDDLGYNFCLEHITNDDILNYIEQELKKKKHKRFLVETNDKDESNKLQLPKEFTKKYINNVLLEEDKNYLIDTFRDALRLVTYIPNSLSPFYNLKHISNSNIIQYILAKYTGIKNISSIQKDIRNNFKNHRDLCDYIGHNGVGLMGMLYNYMNRDKKK